MRKPLNWWYFLFWTGIFIPAIYHLLTNSAFEFDYLHGKFIIDPSSNLPVIFFNFIPVLIITLVFVIIRIIKINYFIKVLMYFLFGLIFILFTISGFIIRKFEYLQNQSHSYFSYRNELKWSDNSEKYYYLIANAVIVLAFLYFFIRNFPRRSGKK